MYQRIILATLLALASVRLAPAQTVIVLDRNAEGRTFDGLGAVSAGASSRLLIDYPEPQRSQILDYLFKPGYGAALQHLKVEIGGEVNSTDGTEPTHMRTATDENYQRGYEWWLMKEAKARNPDIILDCLAWGAPGWIGNGNYWSQDMADYVVKFIKGAKTHHNLDIEYTGIRNETGNDTNWIVTLRNTLNANALTNVKIVAGDEWGGSWNVVNAMLANPAVYNAVYAVGAHYSQNQSPPAAQSLGKPIWSSEDNGSTDSWPGALAAAARFNRNYIIGKMTKTEVWSPITSYYDNLPAPNSGFMRANTPWSGSYYVAPGIWIVAHTTQFAAPGWKYLESGASALLPGGGSIVTLKSTNNTDYSIVLETSGASSNQPVQFRLTNGLSTAAVRVWRTIEASQFQLLTTLTPVAGVFSYTVQPNAVYTFTTTTGQGKGNAVAPAAQPLALPYQDDFESYATNTTPKYLCDQAGTFEVVPRGDGAGQCLRQVLPQVGIRWMDEFSPYTLMGESGWKDYDVSSEVFIETNGFAFVMGRIGGIAGWSDVRPPGYWLKVDSAAGRWELRTVSNVLASGNMAIAANQWHRLRLSMVGDSIRAWVNNVQVAEVTDATHTSGLAAIGCGWHHARFDNFAIRQAHRGTSGNLGLGATASASSFYQNDPTYAAGKANDGDTSSRWNSGWTGTGQEWLELNFNAPTVFSYVTLAQFDDRVLGYKIQGWTGSAWNDLATGGQMGSSAAHAFAAVTNSKVRLLITNMTTLPSIYEFAVFKNAPVTNLASSATASASTVWDGSGTYAAAKANDGDTNTRWNAGPGETDGAWVELQWPQSVSFNRTYVSQIYQRIQDYKIQRRQGGTWVDIVSGGPLGDERTDTFPTVSASRIRFLVVTATNIPSLWEFQVFNDPPEASSLVSPVRINEWMVANTGAVLDPADGAAAPWFELYNAGSSNVNLAGYYLSVQPTNVFQFQIPPGYSLSPGGFLLAWADNQPTQNQATNVDLHVNFSLTAGQTLRLSAPDGQFLDAVTMNVIGANRAEGSAMNGDWAQYPLAIATPRQSNGVLLASEFDYTAQAGAAMVFHGLPFLPHRIQAATNLATPVWVNVATNWADALGRVVVQDEPNPSLPSRFYRAITP